MEGRDHSVSLVQARLTVFILREPENQHKTPEVPYLGCLLGVMESLTESGVLWGLLLELDSQPLLCYLKKLADAPVGAECYCWHGSEKIPAVSV